MRRDIKWLIITGSIAIATVISVRGTRDNDRRILDASQNIEMMVQQYNSDPSVVDEQFLRKEYYYDNIEQEKNSYIPLILPYYIGFKDEILNIYDSP